MATFDTSATGGANGQGGTGGNNANNDLSNFIISADVASSVAGGIGASFLLRLNDAEAGGYLAAAHSSDASHMVFQIGEGAGWAGPGALIFSQSVPLSGPPLTANTFYKLKVTANRGTFSFDFGNGAATTTFTDTTVSATSGQVGIVLDTISPSAATRLDNFTIAPIPEPSTLALLAAGAIGLVGYAWRRRISKPSLTPRETRSSNSSGSIPSTPTSAP